MGEGSKIEWTDHTFNPWWGCSRVSPGCRFCYADTAAQRYGHHVWRRKGDRRMLSDNHWRQPIRWNADAERNGHPARVFCASMADVFEDHPQVIEPRSRLWPLIEATPWLDWQLLTKRPENVTGMVPWGDQWPANVWLGVCAEDQRWADERIATLVRLPARIRFVSAEPLVGPIRLHRGHGWCPTHDFTGGFCSGPCPDLIRPDWVIIGGESGAKARPMDETWALELVKDCRTAGIAPFVKQLGTVWARANRAPGKGGDWGCWPAALRVREYPAEVVRPCAS